MGTGKTKKKRGAAAVFGLPLFLASARQSLRHEEADANYPIPPPDGGEKKTLNVFTREREREAKEKEREKEREG
jgi:hypothetical protein